jgi:MFS family permease
MTRKQGWVLVTLLLGVFMGALDIFIIAPALQAIQEGLQIAPRLVTWSFTAYTLVLVITQPLVAKLSDLYGRRWLYVACVVLFGAGSLLCAVSTSFAPFVLGRCIQAIGAGGVLPVASAVIADVFPEERRGMALGLVASMWGFAFLIGSPIGSVLTLGLHVGNLTTDWHTIFLVNLPFAAIIAWLAMRYLPTQSLRRRANIPFDWNGLLLLGSALFLLIFGLTQINFTNFRLDFTNEAALPFVLLALFLLLAFWLNETHTVDPIVDVRTFRQRQLVVTMSLSVTAGIITSSVVYVPQLVESTLRLHVGYGGLFLLATAVALFIGTFGVGRLIDRYGSRTMMLAGSATCAIGFGLLLLVGRNGPSSLAVLGLLVALMLVGLGLSAFVGTPLRYIVANEAPPNRRAASLSVLTVCNSIGQTMVLPLGGAFIASATVQAGQSGEAQIFAGTHAFYLLVLGIVLLAALLTTLLKSRQAELADRQSRQQAQAAHTTHAATSSLAPTAPNERQPAMSSR